MAHPGSDPVDPAATFLATWSDDDRTARIEVLIRPYEGQRFIPRLTRPYWHEGLRMHLAGQGIVEVSPGVQVKGDSPALRALAAALVDVAGQVEQLQADYDAAHPPETGSPGGGAA